MASPREGNRSSHTASARVDTAGAKRKSAPPTASGDQRLYFPLVLHLGKPGTPTLLSTMRTSIIALQKHFDFGQLNRRFVNGSRPAPRLTPFSTRALSSALSNPLLQPRHGYFKIKPAFGSSWTQPNLRNTNDYDDKFGALANEFGNQSANTFYSSLRTRLFERMGTCHCPGGRVRVRHRRGHQ